MKHKWDLQAQGVVPPFHSLLPNLSYSPADLGSVFHTLLSDLEDRDRKLRIFTGSEHPFGDRPLEPYMMPTRNAREMRPRARRALIRAQKKAEQGSTNTTATKKKKEEKADISA